MNIDYDMYDHLTNDLGIPRAWASRMAEKPAGGPSTFPFESAANALIEFDAWVSTREGSEYWHGLYCKVRTEGVTAFEGYDPEMEL